MKKRIEVYTDAASFNNGCKISNLPQHTASAAVLTYSGKFYRGFGSFNPNSTITYGEMYAIYLGLSNSISILESTGLPTPYHIDLYSDSQYCVFAFNRWMKNWIKNARDGVWYSSNGPVVYQDLMKFIYNEYLLNPLYDINIYHIRGHIDVKSRKSIDKAMTSFKSSNGFDTTLDRVKVDSTFNNICDRYAKAILQRSMEG